MKTYYVWIGNFEESDFEQCWDDGGLNMQLKDKNKIINCKQIRAL